MLPVILAVLTIALVGGAYLLAADASMRSVAARRLDTAIGTQPARPDAEHTRPMRVFPPRYRLIAPSIAIIVLSALRVVLGIPIDVAVAGGALVGVLAYLIEDYRATALAATIETQLASSIDLLVGSLRAGASLLAAFESALQESDDPIRPYLQEVAARIRLGDDPRIAVADLATRVPLENFRLFATSLAVHWEVGGSLATTLTTVGRTVRDRVELSRRVSAQGVEAHASVAVVLVLAYLLGFLMWRSNPDRILAMLSTSIGTGIVAAVIFLQAFGLVWMSRLSRGTF